MAYSVAYFSLTPTPAMNRLGQLKISSKNRRFFKSCHRFSFLHVISILLTTIWLRKAFNPEKNILELLYFFYLPRKFRKKIPHMGGR